MTLKIKKVREDAQVPFRATDGAAGMDLYACIDSPLTLFPGNLVTIPTGISIELPSKEYAAFIYARSGLGIKHGICLSNGVGVVDSDYRGEVCVGRPGERIAQMVIAPVTLPDIEEVDELGNTKRGNGGFGSTGT